MTFHYWKIWRYGREDKVHPVFHFLMGHRQTKNLEVAPIEWAGSIYAIRQANTNLFKIGCGNARTRLVHCQVGNPFDLEIYDCLIHKRLSSFQLEQMAHEALKEYHFKREWYKVPPRVITSLFTTIDRMR